MNYQIFSETLPSGSVWRDIRNISWNAQCIKMMHGSAEEINRMIELLESNGITRAYQSGVNKLITSIEKLINKYFVYNSKNYITLYWLEVWDGGSCPHKMTTNPADMTEQGQVEVTGYKSFCKVTNDFRALYHKSLKQVFIGQKDMSKYTTLIKYAVPRPVNYGIKLKRVIDHYYMADVSSAYAFEGSKDLPTLIDCKIINGRIEPNSEFPFAFYLASHHIKIYNELDTREFLNYNFWYNCDEMYQDVPPNEETTILCKRSEFNLSNIFYEYYKNRYKDQRFKQYVNLAIGYFQRNDNPVFAHLSAVILARCASRILRLARNIESLGNTVVLIATDAVGWIGASCENVYCRDIDKKFGSFVIKYEDTKAVVMGPKKYQVIDNNNKCKTVWAGPKTEYTEKLQFGEMIDSQLVPYRIVWDDDKNKFRECFVNEDTETILIGDEL